ncbi:hypothetical protein Hdeb2414_s0015g00445331 [Helianthus debilis subsp. tardiflorus]
MRPLPVCLNLGSYHLQIIILVFQFLNLITRTILLSDQLLETVPSSGIRHFDAQHLDLGIPPCQGTILECARSILHSVPSRTVTHSKYRFCLLEPPHESYNPFSPNEGPWLTIHEHLEGTTRWIVLVLRLLT